LHLIGVRIKAIAIKSIEVFRQYFEYGIEVRIPVDCSFGKCDFAGARNGCKHVNNSEVAVG
jgi:hypothetical protein